MASQHRLEAGGLTGGGAAHEGIYKYKWLLRFEVNKTGLSEHVPRASRHCRTTLLRWI